MFVHDYMIPSNYFYLIIIICLYTITWFQVIIGSNDNESVLHTPKNSSKGASPSNVVQCWTGVGRSVVSAALSHLISIFCFDFSIFLQYSLTLSSLCLILRLHNLFNQQKVFFVLNLQSNLCIYQKTTPFVQQNNQFTINFILHIPVTFVSNFIFHISDICI